MEDKIVLDGKSFEALAVDTRIKILKSLRERRKTLSEISEEMKMSASGIKEHLEILEEAQLIKKIDDGHKWKYYELSSKGKDIVEPKKELKVWILLSIASVLLLISSINLFNNQTSEINALEDQEALGISAKSAAAFPGPPVTNISNMENKSTIDLKFAVVAISSVVVISCLLIIVKNRITQTR